MNTERVQWEINILLILPSFTPAYYRRILFQIPNFKPCVMFSLFLLVFPTGNALSERDFSAMAFLAHSKQRSELGHAQVFAHLMIGFNGPTVTEIAEELDFEGRQPH
jgi:hypothetical protein